MWWCGSITYFAYTWCLVWWGVHVYVSFCWRNKDIISMDFHCYCRRMIIALFLFRNLTTVSECKVFLTSPLLCLCDFRAYSAWQNPSHLTSCPLLIIEWGFSDWDSDVDSVEADPVERCMRMLNHFFREVSGCHRWKLTTSKPIFTFDFR
jgi:hypothetical protein